jgi:ABC-type sugar transport system ATPase subunit
LTSTEQRAADPDLGAVLVAHDVVKHYRGVTALAAAGISLRAGEIHALVGENGAGKSTLVKILCGVSKADEGWVTLDGAEVAFSSPRAAAAAGIAFVAQELSLFPDLSVRENLFLGNPPRRLGVVRGRTADERAAPVLAQFGLDVDMHATVGDLPLADQQLLEICRAVLQRPRALILDEPTSAQSKDAVARLERVLKSLADRGLAILYISHFLEEVMRIATRISVLRDGRSVMTGAETASVSLGRLVEAMIGTPMKVPDRLPARAGLQPERKPDTALVLRDLEVRGVLDGISMQAWPGEVVGLAGLQGAGHEAVLDAVCGRVKPTAGEVLLPGGARPRTLRHAYASGVGFVPSDRKGLGLMLDKTVWENVTAVSWLGLRRGSTLQRGQQLRQRAATLLERLRVGGTPDTIVEESSGGNQQKVVFAKWMDVNPAVMVLDDPTRGVDVGARAEMHDVIRQFAAQDKIVIVASTDLAELVELCHRVVVFQRGRVVDELDGERLDERTLSTAMNAGFVTAT